MARLLVSAVSNESNNVDVVGNLLVFVSVSRASDGKPVSGLTVENFRIASSVGGVLDPHVSQVSEVEWEPHTSEPSGCYRLSISRGHSSQDKPGEIPHWARGEGYTFGVQVRVFEPHTIEGRPVRVPVDFGQTVLRIESLGT